MKGVVVDVDDTLYLERDYVRSGFAHVDRWLIDNHGVVGVGELAWRLFESGVRRTTLSDALEGVGASPALLGAIVEQYRQHMPAIEMAPDAVRFVRSMIGVLPVSVVTDGPSISQRTKCEALGLFELCESVILTDDMGTSKPDPAVFLAATSDWDLEPAGLVYIADNPEKDFQGPASLGWQCVRIRRPGSLHEQLATPAGVHEIRSMQTLLPLGAR